MSDKVYTIEEINKMLKELLRDKPVYQVILFGSYAKKKATKKSDVDLVIDTKVLDKLTEISDIEMGFPDNFYNTGRTKFVMFSKFKD